MPRAKPTQGTIIKQPSGSYRAFFLLDGKRLTKTFPNNAQAVEWLNGVAEQKANGLTYNVSKVTVGEWLDDWYKIKKASLKINTQDGYGRTIKNHLKPTMGAIRLLDLTPALLQKKYTQLVADGITERPLEIAHTILHQALDHAVRLNVITRNPADLILLPRPVKENDPEATEMHVWSESQANAFLLSVAKERNRNLYHLALATGMRRGEILGLQWDCVDFAGSLVTVKQQAVELPGGGWKFQTPKTKKGRRVIRMGPGLVSAMRNQIEVAEMTRKVTESGTRYTWNENDLVFPGYMGKPQNGYNLSHEFKRFSQRAGLPAITFHDLRHTAASLMLDHHIPIVEVSRILGHSQVSITLDIYAHIIREDDSRAADLMDQLLTPISFDIWTPSKKVV